jgi:hypothetical protein
MGDDMNNNYIEVRCSSNIIANSERELEEISEWNKKINEYFDKKYYIKQDQEQQGEIIVNSRYENIEKEAESLNKGVDFSKVDY